MSLSDYQWVIVVGHPFEGMTLYGPFETLTEAQDFHEHVGLADEIVEVEFDDIIKVAPPSMWSGPIP